MSKVTVSQALVALGLRFPSTRGTVAAITAAGILYAAGYPPAAFREDGSMRPFKPLASIASSDPRKAECDAVTIQHFLVLPLTIGVAVFLFT